MSLAPPPAGSSNTLVADALARAQVLELDIDVVF